MTGSHSTQSAKFVYMIARKVPEWELSLVGDIRLKEHQKLVI